MFGKNQTQLVAIDLVEEISALISRNESGPCRDRTDGPQIKSVSDEDESMPE